MRLVSSAVYVKFVAPIHHKQHKAAKRCCLSLNLHQTYSMSGLVWLGNLNFRACPSISSGFSFILFSYRYHIDVVTCGIFVDGLLAERGIVISSRLGLISPGAVACPPPLIPAHLLHTTLGPAGERVPKSATKTNKDTADEMTSPVKTILPTELPLSLLCRGVHLYGIPRPSRAKLDMNPLKQQRKGSSSSMELMRLYPLLCQCKERNG